MLLKLALGNVRRSSRDYGIYLMTLAFAACLLYSFLASSDYLLALDLTADQAGMYAKSSGVLQGFSVLIVIIFAFLMAYATAFLVKRRRREFGLYALMGMGRLRVSCVLALESALVGVLALVIGLGMGFALSPVFGLVAAFVFGISWQPALVFSGGAALQCCIGFALIAAFSGARAVRSVSRQRLVQLLQTHRSPERRPLTGRGALRAQTALAACLLSLVWGSCLLNPGYFMVFIIPLGFVALFGTYFLFRVLAIRIPERQRKRPERYFSGLRCFIVRQIEARIESGCMAASAVCVLIAAGMCMVVAGLAFSVGLHAGNAPGAYALDAVAYSCIFYGASFLVTAAAILALQELSYASDRRGDYSVLMRMGTPPELVSASLRTTTLVNFAVPLAMACIHCIFGFTLIFVLSILVSANGALAFAGCTLALTVGVFLLYWLATWRSSARILA